MPLFLMIGIWSFIPTYSQQNNYPLVPEQRGFYWVYKNKKGKVIEDGFTEVRSFPDDSVNYDKVVTAVVRDIQTNRYKWAFINTKGQYITDCIYDNVTYLKDGFLVEKDGKLAVIDKYGVFNSGFIYEGAGYHAYYSLQSASIPLRLGKKYGAINIYGEVIIPFEYDAMDYSNLLFQVYKKDKEYHIYNADGKKIFISDIWNYYYLSDRACIIAQNNRFGLIDYNGHLILPVEHLDLSFVQGPEKYILSSESFMEPRSVLYDSTGQIICKTDNALSYPYLSGNRLLIKKKHPDYISLEGMQRMNGNIVIPCIYKKLQPTQNDRLLCVQDTMHKYGLIDTAGNIIIPCSFDSYISFYRENPYTITSFNYQNVIIDRAGTIQFAMEDDAGYRDEVSFDYSNGLFIFSKIQDHHHYSEMLHWAYTKDGNMILSHKQPHNYCRASKRNLLMYDENSRLFIMNYNGDIVHTNGFDGISFIDHLEEIVVCKGCETVEAPGSHPIYTYKKGRVAIMCSLDSVLIPLRSQTRLKKNLIALMQKWVPSHSFEPRAFVYIENLEWLKKEIGKMKKIPLQKFIDN